MARLIGTSAVGFRCQIRAVRLYDYAVQRRVPQHFRRLFVILECQRSVKADEESHLYQLLRGLDRAGTAVAYSGLFSKLPFFIEPSEDIEAVARGIPLMKDKRDIVFVCDQELPLENRPLDIPLGQIAPTARTLLSSLCSKHSLMYDSVSSS